MSIDISPLPSQLVSDMQAALPVFWGNPERSDAAVTQTVVDGRAISLADVSAAQARFERFAPLLARLFPELQASNGRIESALLGAPDMQRALGMSAECGSLWIKADHSLPVAGSIKARGGIHAVALPLHLHGAVGADKAQLAFPCRRQTLNEYSEHFLSS